jgi:hypothetical protein
LSPIIKYYNIALISSINQYRPKGERAEKESEEEKLEREIQLDENSRPLGQKSKEYDV